MKIIKLTENHDGYTLDSSEYPAYVESVKHLLPENIYNFMSSAWHYNPSDSRCLHEARLKSIRFEEHDIDECYANTAQIILNGAYGDTLKLTYTKVSSYSVEKRPTGWPANQSTHGDLITDEMTIMDNTSKLRHELVFEDATVKIIFESFDFKIDTQK
ncbi:hypothetical protein VA602_01070 [Pseudomonas sp. MH2]|uniref:Uncharacterized protein n=1 Tax=Pseudomonas machongensis TaxID=3110229 RepID=A0ABU5V990_9PSED|nr:hypothetical protein [Pseudomonas sp. MH2]MEA5669926.1 hypothetical protein [Pseudomonas sp. MH2]